MKYRKEIDGLRAIAVIPVILFHSGFTVFSGGYVGVDVFFVISGYLITSIILEDVKLSRFSVANFYERRARRILPALLLVMAASLPVASHLMLPPDFAELNKSIASAIFFSSNIFFWAQSGYFDTAVELKPMLHTWSLAVEEQYYILFPLIVLAFWRRRSDRLGLSVIIIGAGSLILAHFGATIYPAATFFLLPTRLWELAIGALIAIYALYSHDGGKLSQVGMALRNLLSSVGLLSIFLAVFLFDHSTPFPSLWALLPTLGTALVIGFATPNTLVGRILGLPIFVGIGLISYSAYLWHQPVLALARHRALKDLTSAESILLIGVVFILSYLSWRFVEKPFRNKLRISRQALLRVVVPFGSMLWAISLIGAVHSTAIIREDLDVNILESFAISKVRSNCVEDDQGFCTFTFSNQKATRTIAIFGDSHANALVPAFFKIAQTQGFDLVMHGFPGCPPLLGVKIERGNQRPERCRGLSGRMFDYVKSNDIKDVFLVARWSLYTDGDYDGQKDSYFLTDHKISDLTKSASRQVFSQAVTRTVNAYAAIGVNLYLVHQVPKQEVDPKAIFLKDSRFAKAATAERQRIVYDNSVDLTRHLMLQSFSRRILNQQKLKPGVRVINLDKQFCGDKKCLLGTSKLSYYRDADHLNELGANVAGETLSIVIN
jgi:peptidoglycan/LPS O-acetylase OafA/YrhL